MADVFGPEVDGAALGLTGPKQLSPDFNREKFADLIETKGYRLAWSRAAVCPCMSVDGQTRAPDPNCPLCKETPGFIFFRPTDYDVEDVEEAGELTPVQKHVVNRASAPSVIVRGIITSVARNEEVYSQVGDWVFGSFNVTVRPENKIGYYDRLVCLDSVMTYSQIVYPQGSTGPVPLRFPAIKVNFCRDIDISYVQDTDFTLNDQGEMVFAPGRRPAAKTRLTVHYDYHPHFLIIEHVNGFRDSMLRVKDVNKRQTPVGNFQTLPIRAVARLEHLLGNG